MNVRPTLRSALLTVLTALAACANTEGPAQPGSVARPSREVLLSERIPDFARRAPEGFSRADAVAIALREWRLWGQPVDDDPPREGPPPTDDASNPARQPGLWERVGEYWWLGVDPDQAASSWTGKHDEFGVEYPASARGGYPWSAAFISYVMRIAGAGARFPYSPSHATYINAAVRNTGWAVTAHPIDAYAPRPGDLVCAGRDSGRRVRFRDLPRSFPAHCEIVVDVQPGQISAISGNVDAAVTLTHIPTLPDGRLGASQDQPLDTRYPWLVVIEVLYDR